MKRQSKGYTCEIGLNQKACRLLEDFDNQRSTQYAIQQILKLLSENPDIYEELKALKK